MADVLFASVLDAKSSMDKKSAELAKQYWSDPVLRNLEIPAFKIPDISIKLRFAVYEVGENDNAGNASMKVIVDTPTLHRIPEHMVSQIEIRLTPHSLRAHNTEQSEENTSS
ncbi:MAG: hypothetical protein H7836_06695 [Magnetococcus sp. YQC-3]